MATKIAVIGGIHGNLEAVFVKLATLANKNGFTLAIIVGDLLSSSSDVDSPNDELTALLNAKIQVPIPTYFSLGRQSLPDRVIEHLCANSGELCTNLYFLGRRTTVKTSEDIKIVALAGSLRHEDATGDNLLNAYSTSYSAADVQVLESAGRADILVTSDWPAQVTRGARAKLDTDIPPSHDLIARLCAAVQPRYHFCSSTTFYERDPFSHGQVAGDDQVRVTRFMGIAPYSQTSKQKWIYGFSLDPNASQPDPLTIGATASPFPLAASQGTKRKSTHDDSALVFSRFSNANGGHNQNRRGKRARLPAPTPQECFFCLSNPNIATHLIASVGDNAYLTTAKGPLSTKNTFKSLDFPGHMLIIPLEHSPMLSAIQDDESRRATTSEMVRYQKALQDMVLQRSIDGPESVRLGAVTWEINRANGVHIHWQFLPCPLDMITKSLVEVAFQVQAENEQYPAITCKTIPMSQYAEEEDQRESDGDHFKARIWNGKDDEMREIRLDFDASVKFDLQFGRRVMAKLMYLDARIDWRDCKQSEEEEVADLEPFKAAFASFDFTNE